jgi:hypothetical protein
VRVVELRVAIVEADAAEEDRRLDGVPGPAEAGPVRQGIPEAADEEVLLRAILLPLLDARDQGDRGEVRGRDADQHFEMRASSIAEASSSSAASVLA